MKRRPAAMQFSGIQFTGSQEGRDLCLEAARSIGAASTILYVHGIGNMPIASVLKRQWDDALFQVDLGQRSRMAYWVNRDYYPVPVPDNLPEDVRQPLAEPDTLTLQMHTKSASSGKLDEAIYLEADSLATTPDQRDKLLGIATRMQQSQLSVETQNELESFGQASDIHAEILPSALLRRLVTRNVTRAFLRDVNDFLYVPGRRERMERSLSERLTSGGPFVVVAHSQGSMIAYKVLSALTRADCDVRLLLTIGSPLGIQEVQDELVKMTGKQLGVPACVARWVNIADRLDPVAVDATLADDYAPRNGVRVEDVNAFMLNAASPRHPHSAIGYLTTMQVHKPVHDTVGPTFAAPVASFVVSRDVADAIEDQLAGQRLNVLIELRQVEGVQGLDAQRQRVIGALNSLPHFNEQAAELERLQRFVAVKLTRGEIESLAMTMRSLNLGRIWRNSEKMALVVDSCNTLHVRPARESYGANGERICWAVLDTGIAANHPHFNSGPQPAVVAQFDCTRWNRDGDVYPMTRGNCDVNGHGTHVAGIIAGSMELSEKGQVTRVSGMAPRASLVGYKVLDDAGRGRDSWIIKALQHISSTNEASAELVIHGINLSLGGNFDPTVYACGHSPLCNELRRLWRQGVLVCVAAGNRGLTEIQTRGGLMQTNLDLTIGDPANLDETIAVGSVHKLNPFTYGISYFSSRGPTADGRIKPDVIAPGEKILSAYNRFSSSQPTSIGDLYVELSGTSMAAPHISGMLACYLSLRREFVGYPDQVKQALLDSCSLLGRDAYSQGRGLPSLMKMLSCT
jgi:subtilisin family serine protease